MQRGGSEFSKTFHGGLTGTSTVHMESVITPVKGSAAYAAVEFFEVTLDGRTGTFFAVHLGVMTRGAESLTVTIVPDSGQGGLTGIVGSFEIQRDAEGHRYVLHYTLP